MGLKRDGFKVGVRSAVGGSIILSNSAVPDNIANGVAIGAFSVTSSGSWTFSLVATYDAGGRVVVSGSNLVATSTPFDYDTATTHTIRVKAVRAAPYAEIVSEFILLVIDVAGSVSVLTLVLPATGTTLLGANISAVPSGNTITVTDNSIHSWAEYKYAGA